MNERLSVVFFSLFFSIRRPFDLRWKIGVLFVQRKIQHVSEILKIENRFTCYMDLFVLIRN